MKNKKMNPASNKQQDSRLQDSRSDKNFGAKQSSISSDLSQTRKAQSPTSQAGTAVKSKNVK